MSDPRTQLVAKGYDELADAFGEWRTRVAGDPRERWREELASRLPESARLLELGCGDGLADTRILSERFHVVAVDLSPTQVALASRNAPRAELVCADFTDLDFDPGSFDAVAAFYSFNHVPRELLGGLLARIHGWLVPGGLLLAAFGTGDTEGWTGDWLGTTMYFSSFPPDTNRSLLAAAGLTVLRDELATIVEPEPDGEATFQWVLATR